MNKAAQLGRFTRDPDIRYSNSEESIAVARFNLAVERRHRKDGQKIYTTDVVAEEMYFAESKKEGSDGRSEPTDENGFMNIPEGIDEELPFN